jgi:hypothetical protein
MTAIFILQLLRWACYSLNPIFSSLGLSIFISLLLPLAGFALYFEYSNESKRYSKFQEAFSSNFFVEEQFLFSHHDRVQSYTNIRASDLLIPIQNTVTKLDRFCHSAYRWVSISIAVGSVLFLTHFLFTAPQTIERFVGNDYIYFAS